MKETVPHKRLDISFMAHQITIAVVVVIAVKNKKASKLEQTDRQTSRSRPGRSASACDSFSC